MTNDGNVTKILPFSAKKHHANEKKHGDYYVLRSFFELFSTEKQGKNLFV